MSKTVPRIQDKINKKWKSYKKHREALLQELGSPCKAMQVKAVCMGRALMVPGMVGKNIGRWLDGEDGGLPPTVSKFGTTKQEIFVSVHRHCICTFSGQPT